MIGKRKTESNIFENHVVLTPDKFRELAEADIAISAKAEFSSLRELKEAVFNSMQAGAERMGTLWEYSRTYNTFGSSMIRSVSVKKRLFLAIDKLYQPLSGYNAMILNFRVDSLFSVNITLFSEAIGKDLYDTDKPTAFLYCLADDVYERARDKSTHSVSTSPLPIPVVTAIITADGKLKDAENKEIELID